MILQKNTSTLIYELERMYTLYMYSITITVGSRTYIHTPTYVHTRKRQMSSELLSTFQSTSV